MFYPLIMGPQKNRLIKMVLLSTYNITMFSLKNKKIKFWLHTLSRPESIGILFQNFFFLVPDIGRLAAYCFLSLCVHTTNINTAFKICPESFGMFSDPV